MASIEHQAERLGPIDREQQRPRIAQELRLLALVDLTHELDIRVLGHQRRHDVIPIRAVNAVDLGGDLERQAGASRDLDGAVRPLLRRDPAEEREIAPSGFAVERQKAPRQAVIDVAHPIDRRGSGRR